jgi:hypothetical protein
LAFPLGPGQTLVDQFAKGGSEAPLVSLELLRELRVAEVGGGICMGAVSLFGVARTDVT